MAFTDATASEARGMGKQKIPFSAATRKYSRSGPPFMIHSRLQRSRCDRQVIGIQETRFSSWRGYISIASIVIAPRHRPSPIYEPCPIIQPHHIIALPNFSMQSSRTPHHPTPSAIHHEIATVVPLIAIPAVHICLTAALSATLSE